MEPIKVYIIIPREISQKQTSTIWYNLNIEPKILHKWTYLQNTNRLIDIDIRLMVATGNRREMKRLGVQGWQIQTVTFTVGKQQIPNA